MTGDITVSFAAPEVQRCPFPHYERLRDERPVYRDPVTGNYVLTRYGDVRRAALDVARLSNRTGLTTRECPAANAVYEARGWLPMDTLANNDPPEHRTYRALVDRVFTPVRVRAIEPAIARTARRLAEALPVGGEFDFLAAFAVPLPMLVIADQLGVDEDDMDRFKAWSNVSVELVSPTVTPERDVEIAGTLVEMQHYLARQIERVRHEPDGRLISHLANAEVDGRRLEVRELLGIIHQILVAGNETTTTTLATAMKLIAERPDLAARLAADPTALLPPFIEEVLRLHAPIQALFRKATESFAIDGVDIPAGAIVELRFGSANRDPRAFADPDALDFARAGAPANLTFGFGLHLCIGNQLARSELRIGLATLLERFEGFAPTRGEDSVRWIESFIAHGPAALFLRADRRAS